MAKPKSKRDAAPVPSAARTGYSGKPLFEKLGIRTGMPVALLGAPDEYFTWLELDPAAFQPVKKQSAAVEMVHLFVRTRAELETRLAPALQAAGEATKSVWVSWPKGGRSDVKEDYIRAAAPEFGWVDVKVCSVSEEWSGLKLMRRKAK